MILPMTIVGQKIGFYNFINCAILGTIITTGLFPVITIKFGASGAIGKASNKFRQSELQLSFVCQRKSWGFYAELYRALVLRCCLEACFTGVCARNWQERSILLKKNGNHKIKFFVINLDFLRKRRVWNYKKILSTTSVIRSPGNILVWKISLWTYKKFTTDSSSSAEG